MNAKIEVQSAVEVKGEEISFNWRDIWKFCGRRKLHIGSCGIYLFLKWAILERRRSLSKGQMIRRWPGIG